MFESIESKWENTEKSGEVQINSCTEQILKDGKTILDATLEYYSNIFPELFMSNRRKHNPLVTAIRTYHDEMMNNHLTNVIEKICHTAQTKLQVSSELVRNAQEPATMEKLSQYGNIYPAMRQVISDYEQHVQMLIDVSDEFGMKYVEWVANSFASLVYGEIMTSVKDKTVSQVATTLRLRLTDIMKQMQKEYSIVVKGYRIIKKPAKTKVIFSEKNKIKTIKNRDELEQEQEQGKEEEELPLKEDQNDEPRIIKPQEYDAEEAAAPDHEFNYYTDFNTESRMKQTISEKMPTSIEARITERFNKMWSHLNPEKKKPGYKMMSTDCLNIQNEFDKFLNDVNIIGTKWMKNLNEQILPHIRAIIGRK